jgi:streptogramin lyase
VTVLDAASGQLIHFDPAVGEIAALPVEAKVGERSRGISAGLTGEVWVANTAGQRVVAIDPQGALLQEIALPAVTTDQPALQPVDVAVMPDNTIFVTDVAGHMLYRFSLAGYLLSSQPIPIANSLDSAHLAVDGAGLLYMTEPEAGRVVQLDPSGLVTKVWSVRVPESQDAKPVGIAVAADGAIWVADSHGGRLLRVIPQVGE